MKVSQLLIGLKASINKKGIENLLFEFQNLKSIAKLYYDARFLYSCDWDNKSQSWLVEYDTHDDYFTVKETAETYLKTFIEAYLEQIENELIKNHLSLEKSRYDEFVTAISIELAGIINANGKDPHIYIRYINDILEEFRNKITTRYLEGKRISVNTTTFYPKIKLLMATNKLSTFLLDYSSEKNNLGKKLFEENIPAFKNLMLACFLDHDGRDLSKATLDTYFDTNKRLEKMAQKGSVVLEESYSNEANVVIAPKKVQKSTKVVPAYPLPKGFK